MLLLQNRYACCMACCCCVHACMRGCLRDRHHISADTSAQTQAWRIEFSYRKIREESIRTKGRAREAASRAPLLSVFITWVQKVGRYPYKLY
jgi:hypothetical protein